MQVAGFAYAQVNKTTNVPDYHHSLAAGDLRQAQLAALALPNVGFSTAVDTGDYTNIHPPDKQVVHTSPLPPIRSLPYSPSP